MAEGGYAPLISDERAREVDGSQRGSMKVGRWATWYPDGSPRSAGTYAFDEDGALDADDEFDTLFGRGVRQGTWTVHDGPGAAAQAKSYTRGRESRASVREEVTVGGARTAGSADPAPVRYRTGGPEVNVTIVGFSDPNTSIIKRHTSALPAVLSSLRDARRVDITMELVAGQDVLVTIDELLPSNPGDLGLDELAMGVFRLDHRRAAATAQKVSMWISAGPFSSAFEQGNAALATAFGTRVMLVRYTNARQEVLSLPYLLGYRGRVGLAGAVVVKTSYGVYEVPVDGRNHSIAPVRDASGALANSAALHAFFEAPE